MVIAEPYGRITHRWKWKSHKLGSVRKRRLKPIRPRRRARTQKYYSPFHIRFRLSRLPTTIAFHQRQKMKFKKFCEKQIKLWKEGKLKQVPPSCEYYAPANIREKLRRERIKRQRIIKERIKKSCKRQIDLWKKRRLKSVMDSCIRYMPVDIRKKYCKEQIELWRKKEVLQFPRVCSMILRSEGKIPKCRIVCRRVCA